MKEALLELLKAKEKVKELEIAYKKVCECNNLLDGTRKKDFNYTDKVISYNMMKIYKTCNYHTPRISRSHDM